MINEPIKCNWGNGPVDFGMSGRTGELWLHVIGVGNECHYGLGEWAVTCYYVKLGLWNVGGDGKR